jgi:hypothetical protein
MLDIISVAGLMSPVARRCLDHSVCVPGALQLRGRRLWGVDRPFTGSSCKNILLSVAWLLGQSAVLHLSCLTSLSIVW